MSDFDKEAERERLREKYEHDEKKREVTEKMSELLLQGATMTNAHCQECGDPIFRYDGQEFCATCERAVQRETGGEGGDAEDGDESAAAEGAQQPAATNGDQEEIEVASPDETRVQFGGDAEADGSDAATEAGRSDTDTEADAPDTAAGPEATGGAGPRAQSPVGQGTPRHEEQSADSPAHEAPRVDPGEAGDLAAAHASLSRTVTQLARQAEATDDLGRKRDLLAATQEAAEALAALRDAGR